MPASLPRLQLLNIKYLVSARSSQELVLLFSKWDYTIPICALGVADGVGGWQSEGIDSAYFSKALMECCSNVAQRKKVDLSSTTKIMSRGYKDLMWLHSRTYGESV